MRLALTMVGLTLVAGLCLGLEARAGSIVFDTDSSATQMISSQLLGTFALDASGTQQFTIDPTLGTANVTSAFTGSDFPLFGQFVTYDLYNTLTTGTVTTNPSGSYDIAFQVLFELKLTSGPLTGFTFETLQNATFENASVPALPFPGGTAFSDLSGGSDAVNIYVKFDPSGTFAPGTLVGTSFDRLVTVNSVVPEPSSLVSGSSAALICAAAFALRRKRTLKLAATI
jgi:hypothetical protein